MLLRHASPLVLLTLAALAIAASFSVACVTVNESDDGSAEDALNDCPDRGGNPPAPPQGPPPTYGYWPGYAYPYGYGYGCRCGYGYWR